MNLHAKARKLGLNAGVPGSPQTDPKRGQAVARLLGYSDWPETGNDRGITHRYRFCLFQLEVLSAWRSTVGSVYAAAGTRPGSLDRPVGGFAEQEGQWLRVDPEERDDMRLRKARTAAFRIMYLCGFDYGMVEIGLRRGRRPTLFALDPYPAMDASLAGQFVDALERYRATQTADAKEGLARAATLGADPEFLLTNSEGKVVPASAYLPKEGPFGCDHVRIGERLLYPLAELRPQPSSDPRRLAGNVRRALLAAAEHIPDTPGVKWLAGSMPAKGFALGGHIHMSGVELNMLLLQSLDNYLALPLVLIEDERGAARRPRYGIPGDFRRQPHGGFEYRTLPSWLVSPRVAQGVLALAALIAKRYGKLRARPLQRLDVLRRYFEGDKAGLTRTVMPLLREIRELPDYAESESLIAPLLAMIESGERWDEKRDIRAAWKIGPFARVPGSRPPSPAKFVAQPFAGSEAMD